MIDAFRRHFQSMAEYNRKANETLFAFCEALGERERNRPRSVTPGHPKSIHIMLNHILTGDRIWMARFEGGEADSSDLYRNRYERFDDLREARRAEDLRIEAFVADLGTAFLETTIRYVNNKGDTHTDPAPMLLAHMFNHQTHHRGQIVEMIAQTGLRPPNLDMHRTLRPGPDAGGQSAPPGRA